MNLPYHTSRCFVDFFSKLNHNPPSQNEHLRHRKKAQFYH